MSEDESDHGGECGALQGRRFKIAKIQWRSPEVTKWLRTMDLVYAGTKINEDQTLGPGNQFRQRYPSALEQVGNPIVGLPRNFYDERWLRALSPYRREQLDVQPEIDINFSVEERRYVPFLLRKYPSHLASHFDLSFADMRLNLSESKVSCRKPGSRAQPRQIRTKFPNGS